MMLEIYLVEYKYEKFVNLLLGVKKDSRCYYLAREPNDYIGAVIRGQGWLWDPKRKNYKVLPNALMEWEND
jgi:hypothetical protein